MRHSSSFVISLIALATFSIRQTAGFAANNAKYQYQLANSAPDRRLTTASGTNSSILIDVENVRGKSGFELSHGQLVDRATVWAERRGLFGKVTLVVDHGSEARGYWLQDRGLGVVFAGPSEKADDVIARDVAYFQKTLDRDCVVVTADRELKIRCQTAALRSDRLGRPPELVPPMSFLDDLERVVYERVQELLDQEDTDRKLKVSALPADQKNDEAPLSGVAAEIEENLEKELREQVTDIEIQLKRRRISQKKETKLLMRLLSLRETLASLNDANLERVTAVAEGRSALPRKMQDDLMSTFEGRKVKSSKSERTGDRVVLAELLRRQLEDIVGNDGDGVLNDDSGATYPAYAHVCYVNEITDRLFSSSTDTRPTSDDGTLCKQSMTFID